MRGWTCIKCRNKFNPISGSNSRLCFKCKNQKCVDCGEIFDKKRADKERCDKCKMSHSDRRAKSWYWKNKEKKKRYDKKRREGNRHLYRDASKRNRKLHPKRKLADTVARRLAIKKRIPPWADLKKIKVIYENCPKNMCVDHIIPLQGKIVSGLHVEENLQYLTPEENMKKSNHYSLEHWGGR